MPMGCDRGIVSAQTAVQIPLKYLASNTFQQTIAKIFNVSQSTVSRCETGGCLSVSISSFFTQYHGKKLKQKRFCVFAVFPAVQIPCG